MSDRALENDSSLKGQIEALHSKTEQEIAKYKAMVSWSDADRLNHARLEAEGALEKQILALVESYEEKHKARHEKLGRVARDLRGLLTPLTRHFDEIDEYTLNQLLSELDAEASEK